MGHVFFTTGSPVEGANPAAEPQVNPKGLFRGHLIIDSLASHYKSAYPGGLASLPDNTCPVGPLVYVIQASQHALNYSKTGKLVIPLQRLGKFSKTNWGDRVMLRGGEMKSITTTSGLTRYIKKLTDRQWSKIVDAAIAAAQTSRKTAKAAEVIEIEELEPKTHALIDNDSD
ncbi:hypothetical protein B0H10DRAFT_2012991 [Mycena sp. CBHHK59/15]|nr:hypothetical protein B0H10DRAFT_2012991 [Mycena sp. CBHHK59/15]